MIDESSGMSLSKADAWLKQNRRVVIAVILGLALALRGVAFYELAESPVMEAHTLSQMDMRFFDEWAKSIVDEDVLCRESRHPMHDWHGIVAGSYYDKHPELLGRPFAKLPKATQDAATVTLWDEWYQGNRFHQEPLYPYFVAAVYAISGSTDVRNVYAVQLVLGVLMVLLLYLLSRRLFGDLTAVVTALIGMSWGPLIHYEVTLLRTSLLSVTGIALLYVVQRVIDRRDENGTGRILKLFAFGCLIGLATALRSTFFVFSLGLLVVLFWPLRKQRAKVLCHGGAVALGVVLMLAPIWIRNSIVDAPLFSMTSVGAITFVGSNVPGHRPKMGWFPHYYHENVAEAMEGSEGSLLGAMSTSIGMYRSFTDYVGLLVDKFVLLWHWFEMPNNTNFYYTCVQSTMLQLLRFVAAASWIMPAAVIGFVLAFRRRRSVGTLLWYFLCVAGPMIVFYVLSRFRAPMIVGMMPLAAYAIVRVFDAVLLKTKQGKSVAVRSVIAFAILMLLMAQGFVVSHPLVGAPRYYSAVASHYLPRAQRAHAAGDMPAVVAVWEELFATTPSYIAQVGPGRPIANDFEFKMVNVLVPPYGLCVQAAAEGGMMDVANQYNQTIARMKAAAQVYSTLNPK